MRLSINVNERDLRDALELTTHMDGAGPARRRDACIRIREEVHTAYVRERHEGPMPCADLSEREAREALDAALAQQSAMGGFYDAVLAATQSGRLDTIESLLEQHAAVYGAGVL